MGSTGTPPKGPERLVLRRRRASDASQQQQQQFASSSQVGTFLVTGGSSSSSVVPAHLQQRVVPLDLKVIPGNEPLPAGLVQGNQRHSSICAAACTPAAPYSPSALEEGHNFSGCPCAGQQEAEVATDGA